MKQGRITYLFNQNFTDLIVDKMVEDYIFSLNSMCEELATDESIDSDLDVDGIVRIYAPIITARLSSDLLAKMITFTPDFMCPELFECYKTQIKKDVNSHVEHVSLTNLIHNLLSKGKNNND